MEAVCVQSISNRNSKNEPFASRVDFGYTHYNNIRQSKMLQYYSYFHFLNLLYTKFVKSLIIE